MVSFSSGSLRRLAVLAFVLLAAPAARAATAPDPSGVGPYTVGIGSYKLPAKLDRDVANDLKVELAAAVWFPKNAPQGAKPLLMFLHGNHSTCGYYDTSIRARVDDNNEYTFSGTCPKGYVMAPSHMGYRYLAERLASWGYVVVSINANRGVNGAQEDWETDDDPDLILRRGRLVLRHLQQLGAWNASGGAPATLGFSTRGSLDFGNIGLLGHSRGGDGVVAAASLLNDASKPWRRRLPSTTRIKGIFAIAPTDDQAARPVPLNLAFAVLLPMCDGDVYDLQGVRFFDRALMATRETVPAPKATYAVWGANHNYYNSEWQQSDAQFCSGQNPLFEANGGSVGQRATAIPPVVGFFRAHVGRNLRPEAGYLLDSGYRLPASIRAGTPIERGYSGSPDSRTSLVLERFSRSTARSDAGYTYVTRRRVEAANIDMPEHDNQERALSLQWSGASTRTPAGIDIFVRSPSAPVNAGTRQSLEIRLAPGCYGPVLVPDCGYPSPLNPKDRYLDGTVRLIDADGKRSTAVRLYPYVALRGPVGIGGEYSATLHPILQSARIPLGSFRGADTSRIRGVAFDFDTQNSGALFVADIRLSTLRASVLAASDPRFSAIGAGSAMGARMQAAPEEEGNQIAAIRTGVASRSAAGGEPMVEIELVSERPFPVTGSGLRLKLGDVEVRNGSFTASGKTDRIVFRLPQATYLAIPNGAEVTVLGRAVDRPWSFGPLDKGKAR